MAIDEELCDKGEWPPYPPSNALVDDARDVRVPGGGKTVLRAL